MKDFLKYFITIIIVAITFIATNLEEPYSVTDEESETSSNELVSYYEDSHKLESEFCFPPQLLSSVTLRQNSSNRANNNQRNNFIFIHEGNYNTDRLNVFIPSYTFVCQSAFVEPSQRLISFRKLII